MNWLVLLAELIVAVDAFLLAVLIVAKQLVDRRRDEFAELRDFAAWREELRIVR